MSDFTTDDLLLYLYDDMSVEDKQKMQQQLNDNWAQREKLSVLKEAVQKLDEIKLHSPREQTVSNILEYARKKITVTTE